MSIRTWIIGISLSLISCSSCSSTNHHQPVSVPDAGTNGYSNCTLACQVKYYKAVPNYRVLTSCMLKEACGSICDPLTDSPEQMAPDPKYQAECPTGRLKSLPIRTSSVLCSNCLAHYCCDQWSYVFNFQDGIDLNNCLNACSL